MRKTLFKFKNIPIYSSIWHPSYERIKISLEALKKKNFYQPPLRGANKNQITIAKFAHEYSSYYLSNN